MANPHPLPSPDTEIAIGENLCEPEDKLSPLAQIKRMQRVIYKRTQSDNCEDKVLPALACAWERLEGRKGILTMRPAPKPIDVTKLHRGKRGPKHETIRPTDEEQSPPEPGSVQ